MLQSLINNFTILTTFLFFGNMLWGKWKDHRFEKKRVTKFLLGAVFGLFGVFLMHYTFPMTPHVFADFRQLPILISVYMGGWVAGFITTLMIAVYRLLFLSGFNFASIMGAVNALGTLLTAVWLLRNRKLSFRRWGAALGISAVISAAVFALILSDTNKWIPIGEFMIVFIIGGMFTFAMLMYLKRSDDSVRIMREAAHRDFLTGLYNVRAFEVVMNQRIAHTNRYRIPFTLLMIDIDHFKRVNDTYGHPAGDAVLSQMADVLRDTFRPGDQIARKGGEEFVVIVDECDAGKIGTIAERLRQNVEDHPFLLPDGTTLKMTISVGSATYPDFEDSLLVEKADQALYEAKAAGRNRVCRAAN